MTIKSGILEGREEEVYLIEDDFDEEDFCDCSEYEIDWEGRATCDFCRRSWWATPETIRAHEEAFEQYCIGMERQERRERWLGRLRRLAFWRRRKPNTFDDDEIPF